MNLEIELLKCYKCRDLNALLDRASFAFQMAGFPYLILKWEPTPGSDAAMIANSQPVWSNFTDRLGPSGVELTHAIGVSVADSLKQAKSNTRDRQTWKSRQSRTFLVARDAPQDYHLTRLQRSLICDFGELAWREFVSRPLCKERDRILLLEAKTQAPVTKAMIADAQRILSVFESVYRSFHSPDAITPLKSGATDTEPALSRREIECLRWLAAGKTLQEAAMILDISERTLRFHIANARKRLGVATTMQAVVAAALRYGFNPLDARRSIYTLSRAQL